MPTKNSERDDPAEQLRQPAIRQLAGVLHALRLELLGELRILDARVGELLRLLRVGAPSPSSVPRIDLVADRHLGDLAVLQQRLELASTGSCGRPARGSTSAPDRAASRNASPYHKRRRRPRAELPRPAAIAAAGVEAWRRFSDSLQAMSPSRAVHCPATACCFSNVSPPPPASTTMVSPSRKSPSSTRSASGSSTRR